MKIVFVNDSTSNPNWGDRAAAIALRTMMTEAGGRVTHTLTESALGTTSFEGDAGLGEPQQAGGRDVRWLVRQIVPPGVLAVRRRLAVAAGASGSGLIPERWEDFARAADRVAGARTPWPALVRALGQADVMVIHGDGAMTGNGIIPRTMLFLAYVAKKRFEKPVIIVSHTGDFSRADLRAMAAGVYPLLDDVVFRDPVSVESCRQICDGRYAPDPAFLFAPAARQQWAPLARRSTYFDVWPDTAAFDPGEPYVCLGGSSILGTSSRTADIMAGYRAVVRSIGAVYDGRIVLTVSDITDQPLFRALAREFDLPLAGLATPVQQVFDLLGNADAYIGGRWHPSLAALRGGAPIVPLSAKTTKMQALAQMVGLPSSLPDALSLEAHAGTVAGQLRSLLDQGEELRTRLRTWAEAEARGCGENLAYLKTL